MQLAESENRLEETQRKLARLRSRGNPVSSTKFSQNGVKVKEERRSCSPVKISQHSLPNHGDRGNGNSSRSYAPDHPRNNFENRPPLVIPAVYPKSSALIKMDEAGNTSGPTYGKGSAKEKGNRIPPEQEVVEAQSRGTKRKFGNIYCFLLIVHHRGGKVSGGLDNRSKWVQVEICHIMGVNGQLTGWG